MINKSFVPLTILTLSFLTACSDPHREDNGWLSGGVHLGDPDPDSDDSSGAGSGDLDSAANDGLGPPECARERFDLGVEPSSVMLVLDKSSSMSEEQWLHDGELVTRWSSLHGVVSELLTTYDTTLDFGATLFPAIDSQHWNEGYAAACDVAEVPDVATGPFSSAAILQAIPGPGAELAGATPARAGMTTALQHLTAADHGARAVVLVTDGLANCTQPASGEIFLYDEGLPLLVGAAYEELGIPTYVVGIDIRDAWVDYAQANAHEVLDEVASRGGVARDATTAYYAADDESALFDAMEEIATRIECTVPLAAPVPDQATFDVWVDGQPMSEIHDCATEDGWRFTDPHHTTIELCGAACDALRVQGQMETEMCEREPIYPVP